MTILASSPRHLLVATLLLIGVARCDQGAGNGASAAFRQDSSPGGATRLDALAAATSEGGDAERPSGQGGGTAPDGKPRPLEDGGAGRDGPPAIDAARSATDSAPEGQPERSADGGLAAQASGSGLPGPREACYGLKGDNRLLPGTNVRYCVGAHPDCKAPGAGCPLYVTFNTTGAYFKRLQDPARWGKFITVESRQEYEGATVGDPFAELPRVIARDYPGLDESRIYAVGNSRGAAAITRSLCRRTYHFDQSKYGSVTDVYAAVAAFGICPTCDDGFVPRAGNIHFLVMDGWDDTSFAKDHCQADMRRLAASYRCERPEGTWCNVAPDDGLVKQGDGTDKLRKMTFGACQRGALVSYMARDEMHIVTATKNFTPPLSGYDLAWDFFQNKRKSGGESSVGKLCAP